MKRPYKAPLGVVGCVVTIVLYVFMLIFADKMALLTSGIITVACIIFYYLYSHKKNLRCHLLKKKSVLLKNQMEKQKEDG